MPIAYTPPTPPFPVEFWQTNTSPDIAKCLSNKITPWLRTTALQCIHSGYKNNPLITETRLCTTSANTWPIDFHYHSGKKKKKVKVLTTVCWLYMICYPPLLLELLSYFSPLYSLCSNHTCLFTILQIHQQNSHLKVRPPFPSAYSFCSMISTWLLTPSGLKFFA